jgi:hypothetical protein
MDSLELFATEVMPEFHDNDDAHQAWKHGVLAGDIELDDIDVTPYITPTSATPTKPPSVTV